MLTNGDWGVARYSTRLMSEQLLKDKWQLKHKKQILELKMEQYNYKNNLLRKVVIQR